MNARGRMAFEFAGKLAQSHHARYGKNSGFGQRGIEKRGGVTLGEDETVAVVRIRVLGIKLHSVEENSGDKFRGGHAGSGVAGPGGGGGHHGINGQQPSVFLNGCDGGGGRSNRGGGAHESSFSVGMVSGSLPCPAASRERHSFSRWECDSVRNSARNCAALNAADRWHEVVAPGRNSPTFCFEGVTSHSTFCAEPGRNVVCW